MGALPGEKARSNLRGKAPGVDAGRKKMMCLEKKKESPKTPGKNSPRSISERSGNGREKEDREQPFGGGGGWFRVSLQGGGGKVCRDFGRGGRARPSIFSIEEENSFKGSLSPQDGGIRP